MFMHALTGGSFIYVLFSAVQQCRTLVWQCRTWLEQLISLSA
jgi:hypothetical protein